jgi:hypothetical protein
LTKEVTGVLVARRPSRLRVIVLAKNHSHKGNLPKEVSRDATSWVSLSYLLRQFAYKARLAHTTRLEDGDTATVIGVWVIHIRVGVVQRVEEAIDTLACVCLSEVPVKKELSAGALGLVTKMMVIATNSL